METAAQAIHISTRTGTDIATPRPADDVRRPSRHAPQRPGQPTTMPAAREPQSRSRTRHRKPAAWERIERRLLPPIGDCWRRHDSPSIFLWSYGQNARLFRSKFSEHTDDATQTTGPCGRPITAWNPSAIVGNVQFGNSARTGPAKPRATRRTPRRPATQDHAYRGRGAERSRWRRNRRNPPGGPGY